MSDEKAEPSALTLVNVPENIKIALSHLENHSLCDYYKIYIKFLEWVGLGNIKTGCYDYALFLRSEGLKASYIFKQLSIIKTILLIDKNIDIKQYPKLWNTLKGWDRKDIRKKARGFSPTEYYNWLKNGPECGEYARHKCLSVIGTFGLMRNKESHNLLHRDVIERREGFKVTIRERKNTKEPDTIFVGKRNKNGVRPGIIIKNYLTLLDRHVLVGKFYKRYHLKYGKYINQTLSAAKLSQTGKIVGRWLKLSDWESCTGHCWRVTGGNLVISGGGSNLLLRIAGNWTSQKAADEYIRKHDSTKKKIFDVIQNGFGPIDEQNNNNNNNNNHNNNNNNNNSNTSKINHNNTSKINHSDSGLHFSNCTFNILKEKTNLNNLSMPSPPNIAMPPIFHLPNMLNLPLPDLENIN